MKNFQEKFGTEAEDKVTGFKGIVSGYAHYITGCGQFLLNPKVNEKNNDTVGKWFDEGRLDFSKDKKVDAGNLQGEDNGCDINAPIK